MADITVKQLAEVVGISVEKLISQMQSAGLSHSDEAGVVSDKEKKTLLEFLKKSRGEEAEVDLFGDNVEIETRSPKGNRTKGERFDFYVKGLKDGDQVTFIDDLSIVAIVANSRQVLFEGELWYLSALARELYTRRNQVSLSGSYQGPAYFVYNGTKLNEIKRLQTE
jgi:hypothetical protein